MPKDSLPEAIHRARERLGLTQAELAKRLGVTQAALSRWESGKRRCPLEKLLVWALAYSASLSS